MSTRDNFLPLSIPDIGDEEKAEILDTLDSGWLSKGPKTKRFEYEFAQYVGSKYALSVSSCTAALHLALKSVGIGPGDEVITSPLTFIATVNAILYIGATPVLADIEGITYNIDPKEIQAKITSHTKAIIPVHFAGHPCAMDEIMEIARNHNIFVIEDAAHAVGSGYKGRKVGGIGDITCFSFYATKGMTTGDGGMITTNREDLYQRMEMLSLHGMSTDAWERYSPSGNTYWDIVEPGFKYNMTDIQASLGIHQLRKLDKFIEKRTLLVNRYNTWLESFHWDLVRGFENICTPDELIDVKHSWYIYPITCGNIDRTSLIESLKEYGIGTGIHFMAIHLRPYYAKEFGWKRDNYPIATRISDTILSLPLFTKMTDSDVDKVCYAIKEIVQRG